jgi:hypothetical protein
MIEFILIGNRSIFIDFFRKRFKRGVCLDPLTMQPLKTIG